MNVADALAAGFAVHQPLAITYFSTDASAQVFQGIAEPPTEMLLADMEGMRPRLSRQLHVPLGSAYQPRIGQRVAIGGAFWTVSQFVVGPAAYHVTLQSPDE